MKKRISIVIALVLCMALVTAMFIHAKDTEIDLSADYCIIVSEMNMEDITPTFKKTGKNKVVFHNNGNALQSDYNEEEHYLLAVTCIEYEYGIEERAYFSTLSQVSKEKLKTIITTADEIFNEANAARKADIPAGIKSSDYVIRSYSEDCTDLLGTEVTVAASVTFIRESSTADINGVTGSVWDVKDFVQYEKGIATRINHEYTTLKVSGYAGENLESYGPTVSSGTGTITVGLSGIVPSMSYTFSISGYHIKNQSSLANDYGKWYIVDYIGSENSFVTEPGIRVSNTSGSLLVKQIQTINYTDASSNDITRTFNWLSTVPDR